MILVRPATVEDAAAIAAVQVTSWQAAYQGIFPAEFLANLSVERRRRHWQELLNASPPGSAQWVAEEAGTVVGFASAGPGERADWGELYAIYLLPEVWGRGVGRRLLAEVERWAAEQGHGGVYLWVLAANRRARRAYQAAGWSPEPVQRLEEIGGGGGVQVTELRYARHLDS